MKHTLLFLLFIYVSQVFSQADSTIKENKAHARLGFTFAPEINTLKTGNNIGKETVKSGAGFSAGIQVMFKLTNNIRVRTGLSYGFKTYRHTHSELIFPSDIHPQLGVISYSSIESKLRYSELQLPVAFHFYFLQKLFYFSTGADFILPFADVSKRTAYYGNGTSEQLQHGESSLYIAPTCGIGYMILYGARFRLRIEPFCRFYLREYTIIGSRLLNVGMRFAFNLP